MAQGISRPPFFASKIPTLSVQEKTRFQKNIVTALNVLLTSLICSRPGQPKMFRAFLRFGLNLAFTPHYNNTWGNRRLRSVHAYLYLYVYIYINNIYIYIQYRLSPAFDIFLWWFIPSKKILRDVHLLICPPRCGEIIRTLEMALTSKCRPTRTKAKAKTPHQSNASVEKALSKKLFFYVLKKNATLRSGVGWFCGKLMVGRGLWLHRILYKRSYDTWRWELECWGRICLVLNMGDVQDIKGWHGISLNIWIPRSHLFYVYIPILPY